MDQANEQSIEDRLAAVLGGDIEDDAEEITEEDDSAEVEAEAEEADSKEEPAEPIKLKLKRGDEEVEVDIEEAKNLAQMGYDYTKKTQEVAEQRKQVEMYAQAVKAQENAFQQQVGMQQAFIKEIAKVEAISDQISQYEQINWQSLADSDPVQAQKLWITYQQLQTARSQSVSEIQSKQQQLAAHQAQQNSLRMEQARQELQKSMPDFNQEKAYSLREAAKSYGFTDQELSAISDPRTVKLLADAAAYRKLQSEKANVTKKVSDKPAVVKPGARDNNSAQKASMKDARQTLKKSGRYQDAASLIERML